MQHKLNNEGVTW